MPRKRSELATNAKDVAILSYSWLLMSNVKLHLVQQKAIPSNVFGLGWKSCGIGTPKPTSRASTCVARRTFVCFVIDARGSWAGSV